MPFSDLSDVKSRTFTLQDTVDSFAEFNHIIGTVWPHTQTENNTTLSGNDNCINAINSKCENCMETSAKRNFRSLEGCNEAQVSDKSKSQRYGVSVKCDEASAQNDSSVNLIKTDVDTETSADLRKAKSDESHQRTNTDSKHPGNKKDKEDVNSGDNVISSGICMIGLHCCGPLTPAILHLFHMEPQIKALVCLSCCYHNMNVQG